MSPRSLLYFSVGKPNWPKGLMKGKGPHITVKQWRRQDLLRGGAKLEVRLWGTHGELQGWLQQLLDD